MKKIVDIILDKLNNNKLSDEEKLNFLANCYRELKNIQQRVEWSEKKYKGYAGYKKIYKKYLGSIEKYIKEIEIIFADKNNNSISDLSQRTKDLSIDIIKNIKNNNLPIINENFGYTFGFTCIFSFIICILLIFFLGIEDIGSIHCSTLVFGILSFAFIFGKGYEALLKERLLKESNTRRFLEKTNEPKNINMLNNETVDSNNINITKTPQQPVVKKSNYNNYQLSLYEDNNSIEEQNKIKEELQDTLNKIENTQTETNFGINTQNVSKNTSDILQNNRLIISQSISEEIGASYDFSDVIEYFDINIDSLPKHERLLDNKVTNGFIDNVDILKQCNIKKLDDNCRYMLLLFESFEYLNEKSVYTFTFVIDKRYLYSEGAPFRYTYTNTGTTLLLLVVGTGDFFYNRALKYVEEGLFEKAIKDLKQAIRHVTDYGEKAKLQNMLNKIENGTYINKNETQKQTDVSSLENDIKTHTVAKDIITDNSIQEIKEINIQNCTKEEIQTLEGFSVEKAERFIQERKNGKMWYDIDSFVQDFELQPHEMVMIQDRIKFPEKPKNKYGRKIDI